MRGWSELCWDFSTLNKDGSDNYRFCCTLFIKNYIFAHRKWINHYDFLVYLWKLEPSLFNVEKSQYSLDHLIFLLHYFGQTFPYSFKCPKQFLTLWSMRSRVRNFSLCCICQNVLMFLHGLNIQFCLLFALQGGASSWTAEEENDCISMKKNKSHKKYIVIFSKSVFVWLLHLLSILSNFTFLSIEHSFS